MVKDVEVGKCCPELWLKKTKIKSFGRKYGSKSAFGRRKGDSLKLANHKILFVMPKAGVAS